MIDPVRRTDSAQPHLGPGTGTPPAPITHVRIGLPEQIIADPTIWPELTSAQSQLILALVRAVLESFASPGPANAASGTVELLHAALASFHALERDLTATLARHQDGVINLEPVLDALIYSARADAPGRAAPSPTPSPPPPPTPAAATIAELVQSLGDAIARLQETFGSTGGATARLDETVGSTGGAAARLDETGGSTGGAAARLDETVVSARVAAGAQPQHVDQLDAFRWLLDAAHASTPGVSEPRSQPATVFDRYPAVVRLLTPILLELGLLTPNAEPLAGTAYAEIFATAVARLQLLASVIAIDAQTEPAVLVGGRAFNPQLLAELEAAGMPPFTLPVDAPANLEAFRWLLLAAQAYHFARVGARPPRQRCERCGRMLQPTPMGELRCPSCDG